MPVVLARIAVFAVALTCAHSQQQPSDHYPRGRVVGYLYTSLNGEHENKVIRFARLADGSLQEETAFPTGSLGGSNKSRGGAALGGFDTQQAMQIVEDALLVVNAGGNTISVFKLDRATGDLVLHGIFDSQGVRPVSIAVLKRQEWGKYWVVVGNQLGNPNVQFGSTSGEPLQFFPDKEFITTGRKELDTNRNIYLFSFDIYSKMLTPVRRIDAFVGTNGGPACVAFSPDGTKLALSTWGIAHIFTFPGFPGEFQQPSRVYVYDFDRRTGQTSGRRFFEAQGVAGTIGFNWSPDAGRDLLYVSNFNLASDVLNFSVTVLDASPPYARPYDEGIRSIQNFVTGVSVFQPVEDCWTFVSRDSRHLWVSGFGTNIVSSFDIVPYANKLGIVGPGFVTEFVSRPPNTPLADTKDLWQSPDEKYLYVLGSLESYAITRFSISGPSLTLVDETIVESATPRKRGFFNFLGLTGFDLSYV